MAKLKSPTSSKIALYSLNYSETLLKEMPFARYFHERSYCHLALLRNEEIQLVLVTSESIDGFTIDYHLRDLYQMSDEQQAAAKERLILLTANTNTSGYLIDQVLNSQETIEKLKGFLVGDTELINFSSSEKINLLGQILGASVQESAHLLSQLWGSKSGSRKVLSRSNVSIPRGTNLILKDLNDVRAAALDLSSASPPAQYVILKLNSTSWSSGLGNVLIDCKKLIESNDLSQSVSSILQPWEDFADEVAKEGAIVEEYLLNVVSSPSAQGYIDPDGEVKILSTHEQILEQGKFLGCVFPADARYLFELDKAARKIGSTLRDLGIRGAFGVDFLGFKDGHLLATEINIRKLGTSHVLTYVEAILEAGVGTDGLLRNRNGIPIYYVQKRVYEPLLLKYLSPELAIEVLKESNLFYSHDTQSGVVLLAFSALENCGFVEVIAIGQTRSEAFVLSQDAQVVLFNRAELLRANSTGIK